MCHAPATLSGAWRTSTGPNDNEIACARGCNRWVIRMRVIGPRLSSGPKPPSGCCSADQAIRFRLVDAREEIGLERDDRSVGRAAAAHLAETNQAVIAHDLDYSADQRPPVGSLA